MKLVPILVQIALPVAVQYKLMLLQHVYKISEESSVP